MNGPMLACALLSMCAAYSYAEEYIISSLDANCPQESCLTLPQFAAEYNSYYRNDTELSLIFLPGNHTLDCELSLAHIGKFSMISTNRSAFVNCAGLGRFTISNAAFLSIKGLYFIGCGGNTASQVEDLEIKDTVFEGVEDSGTVLTLVGVSFTIITRGLFLFNSHLNHNNSENLIQTTINNNLDSFTDFSLEQNASYNGWGIICSG